MKIALIGTAALLTAGVLVGCSNEDDSESTMEATQEATVVEEEPEDVDEQTEDSQPAASEEPAEEPAEEPETSEEQSDSVGGMTDCELGTVQAAADQAAEALGAGNTFDIFMFTCEDGWLVVEGDLTAEGDSTSAPTTFLFEAEGQFWVPKDLAEICVSEDPDDPASRPGDAFLPVPLLNTGVCETA